ncbi:MAG: hypothetical protein LBL69_00615 [Zoogloeaceae bacterium]|jgi:hypothetical protein|nr:hypothetical protein [Zoogloeaceae bacterium]
MENTRNRPANLAELEHARHALLSLGTMEQLSASLLEGFIRQYKMDSEWEAAAKEEESWPVVVRDFSALSMAQDILLVPPGVHEVPAAFFGIGGRRIIGLATDTADYPTLLLQGKPERIDGNGKKTLLHVCDSADLKFSNVRLDAKTPTILNLLSSEMFFSEDLMQCTFGYNIDVLHDFISDGVLLCGRDWALDAYGPDYKKQPMGYQALDAFHEGSLKAIDTFGRSLVSLGGKLDNWLGLK